jgi:hypothetical protein
MPLYTSAEIKTKIDLLDAKIAKAEEAQEIVAGGPGAGQHTVRGSLGSMYKERERLEKLYAAAEGREQGTGLAQGACYRRET